MTTEDPIAALRAAVLAAGTRLTEDHGESCDCNICLVVQPLVDAALTTPEPPTWACDWEPDDLNPGPDCPYCAGKMCARFDNLNCTHDVIERHGYAALAQPAAPAATYELWDRDTANIIGTYNTLSELVATVVGLSQANPDMRPDDLLVAQPAAPAEEPDVERLANAYNNVMLTWGERRGEPVRMEDWRDIAREYAALTPPTPEPDERFVRLATAVMQLRDFLALHRKATGRSDVNIRKVLALLNDALTDGGS